MICPQHGLGNRLRALASAVAVSQKLGLMCHVRWIPDHHCECALEDLVEHEFSMVGKIPVDWYQTGFLVVNTLDKEKTANCETPLEDLVFDRLYVRSQKVLVTRDPMWDEENAVLRQLKVLPHIEERVASLGDLGTMVGVHIRMEAARKLWKGSYDDPGQWDEAGRNAMFTYRAKSHYRNFLPVMDQLVDSDGGQQFFVAADRDETYRVLRKRYGPRIVSQKRGCYDRSRDQILEAWVDALALSRCRLLLGSYWSSFSELALRLGGMPFKLAGKHF